jgi:hypothetical protein
MSKHFSARIWPIVLLGATTACAHVGDSTATEQSPRKPVMREHESVTGVAGDAKKVQAGKSTDLVGAIANDLSQRLGVGVAQIEVVSMDAMTWNDGSLGCPQPGQSYLQALTPGVRVVLKNSGQLYEYHASNSGTFVYCRNPTRTPDGLDRQ